MSNSDKHLLALLKTPSHHRAGGLSGGKCIVKHKPSPYKENNSCSYRWQAFEKALEKASLYEVTDEQLRSLGNGRWTLLFGGGEKAVTKLEKLGETVEPSPANKLMYRHEVQKPRKGEWDVARGKDNFKKSSNKPYYHEAHHVVPDATLRAVIVKIFTNPLWAVRVVSEMLEAPYNVHHKDNMIILPMDECVGDLLDLPIHRETNQCKHTGYDLYIEKKLETRLRAALRDIMEKHDEEGGEPQYKDLAKSIEEISRATYEEVANARSTHRVTSIEEFGKKMLPSSL